MLRRPRSTACPADLVECFRPLVHRHGISFVTYADENPCVARARLVKDGAGSVVDPPNIDAVRSLYEVCGGRLTFSRTKMRMALDILATEFEGEWQLKPNERADFVETLCRRIRNLTRIVTQATMKSQTAPWLRAMIGDVESAPLAPRFAATGAARGQEADDGHAHVAQEEDEEEEEEEEEESEEYATAAAAGEECIPLRACAFESEHERSPTVRRKPAAATTKVKRGPAPAGTAPSNSAFELAWCSELMLPVRRRVADGGTSRPEPGLVIEARIVGRSPCDEVLAEWPDGMVEPIPAFTYERLALLCREATRPRSSLTYFEAEHELTKHRLSIVQKVDRKLLMVINEQNRQVLQVNMSTFGVVPDEKQQLPPTHATTIAAGEFLKSILLDYAKGSFDRAKLKEVRNAKLATLGLGLRSTAGCSSELRRSSLRWVPDNGAAPRHRLRAKVSVDDQPATKKSCLAAARPASSKKSMPTAPETALPRCRDEGAPPNEQSWHQRAPPLVSSLDVLAAFADAIRARLG